MLRMCAVGLMATVLLAALGCFAPQAKRSPAAQPVVRDERSEVVQAPSDAQIPDASEIERWAESVARVDGPGAGSEIPDIHPMEMVDRVGASTLAGDATPLPGDFEAGGGAGPATPVEMMSNRPEAFAVEPKVTFPPTAMEPMGDAGASDDDQTVAIVDEGAGLEGQRTPTPARGAVRPPRLDPGSVQIAQPLSVARPPADERGAGEFAGESMLESAIDAFLEAPVDASFRAQLDQRLVAALAGRYVEAREPLELVSDSEAALARELVELYIAVRQADGFGAAEALDSARTIEKTLAEQSGLRIPRVQICWEVRGFGQYEPIRPAEFRTGVPIEFVLYVELQNYAMREAGEDAFEACFNLTTEIYSSAGELILSEQDAGIKDRCRARRQDCFLPKLVRLPATLSPGAYVAKVRVTDTIGAKIAEQRAAFRVTAR